MSAVALHRPPVHAAEDRLDGYIGHLHDQLARESLARADAWLRIRDLALRMSYTQDEAEQIADRVVYQGELPL